MLGVLVVIKVLPLFQLWLKTTSNLDPTAHDSARFKASPRGVTSRDAINSEPGDCPPLACEGRGVEMVERVERVLCDQLIACTRSLTLCAELPPCLACVRLRVQKLNFDTGRSQQASTSTRLAEEITAAVALMAMIFTTMYVTAMFSCWVRCFHYLLIYFFEWMPVTKLSTNPDLILPIAMISELLHGYYAAYGSWKEKFLSYIQDSSHPWGSLSWHHWSELSLVNYLS